MNRSKHYLRKNTTSRRPSRLVFVDCDSNDEKLPGGNVRETFKSAAITVARKRGAVYVVRGEVAGICSPGTALDMIVSQSCNRSRVLVISPKPVRVLTLLKHIDEMKARGWTLDTPVSSARFTAIAWRKESRTLLFVAHGNLFPMQQLRNDDAAHRVRQMRETWLEYLKLLDELDAGDFHMSLGAQSLGIYRHRFLQHPILFHGNKRADELEQRACFGALYQPYWFGVAPQDMYYYLDTNAMYPAMMKQFKYPWRLAGLSGRVPITTLLEKLDSYSVIATVRLETNDALYPVRINDRTVFPVGEFTTTLTTPDLCNAAARAHIHDVYALAWYDRADLFSLFVKYFWDKRREFNSNGKLMWASWSKAMMVSLYGRFGAHVFETRSEGENPFDCDRCDQLASLDSGEVRWYHTLAGKMWSTSRAGFARESFPAIMAHVSAYGRNRMMQLMSLAGHENVFVVLSDGLIVNQAGYNRLWQEIQTDSLGMLKLKLSGDDLEVRSDVEFRLADHQWQPGVKPGALEVRDGVFVEHLDPNLPSLARSGDTSEYVRRRVSVTLSRQIKTGTVREDGRITPLHV